MAEKSTSKLVPWGLHPMPNWILGELKNRAQEYGNNPNASSTTPYSGPRSAWVRVFSNGVSRRESEKVATNGFVMGGTETFEESYGFGQDKKITIGVDAVGNPHEIDATISNGSEFEDDFPHRPPPSIVSITCEFSGGAGNAFGALCRKTTINWKCYSLNQLNYLIPYFLSPRISLVVEWGWNNYSVDSLIDLTDTDLIKSIWNNTAGAALERIKSSNGNYDFHMGMIMDYGYRLAEDGGYECHTTIMNPNFMIEGQAYQENTVQKIKEDGTQEKMKDFIEFSNFDLKSIKSGKKASIGKQIVTDNGIGDTVYERENIFEYKTPKENQIFSDDKNTWLRMDLVADIINAFFKREFKDKDGNLINVGLTKLDITTYPVAICANPAIKSVNPDILIPNKTAPRFAVPKDNYYKGDPAPNTYNALFPGVSKTLKKYDFAEEYDNLQEAIGAENSFPRYEDSGDVKAGTYGYLTDIYISTKLLQEEIKNNVTVKRLLDAILQRISNAMCDIVSLRVVPAPYNNDAYSVQDMNFSTVNTPEQATGLLNIDLNSTRGAFIRNGKFEIKISQDMMNQMIGVSLNTRSNKDITKTTYDPKYMRYDPTSLGDRIFGYAESRDNGPSISSKESGKKEFARMFSEENEKTFYIYKKSKVEPVRGEVAAKAGRKITQETRVRQYILAEKDSQFIKNVLIAVNNPDTMYNNNPPMLGTQFTADFLGIGGITYLSQFTLSHVPSTYNYKNAVWQVDGVTQKVENKLWTTTVKATARPLTILTKTETNKIKPLQ